MKQKLSILFFLLSITSLQAQQQRHFTGLLLDDSAYARIPQKPELLTRSYDVLPKSHSLRQYCPVPRSQGDYSTCTSWATAYAARTIAEAIANNWQEPVQITKEAFSPLFTYALLRAPYDIYCQEGIYLPPAFKALKDNGTVKYNDFDINCSSVISNKLYSKAMSYVIDDYFTLFPNGAAGSKKINATKKSIAENRPVVISMANYTSFGKNTEEVWSGITDFNEGYHAMCVVAYDDDKYGGAFLLMNSWGTRWGDAGFKWVRYEDYGKYVNYAMEMLVKRKKTSFKPAPKPPAPIPSNLKFVDLAGKLRFVLSTGIEMPPKLYTINNTPFYKLEGSYISGTRYRLYLSNYEPAYIYVIGSDLTNAVNKVFPPNNRISPALVYKSNEIAIPDENWHIEMDGITGKDYICVLYSKSELPIDDIIVQIKAESGSFFDKINKVLKNKTVPAKTIKYGTSAINFSVKNTDKTLVPIIVEIDHR